MWCELYIEPVRSFGVGCNVVIAGKQYITKKRQIFGRFVSYMPFVGLCGSGLLSYLRKDREKKGDYLGDVLTSVLITIDLLTECVQKDRRLQCPAGKQCPCVDLENVHVWTSQIMYICVRILKCPCAWTLPLSTHGHFWGPRVDISRCHLCGPLRNKNLIKRKQSVALEGIELKTLAWKSNA
jgi:hypothetical protein